MEKLTLDLSDLSVDTFAADTTTAECGTVEGQAAAFTDGCQTAIIDCDPYTDDEPNCPIIFTDDISGCVPCIPETEQVDCFYK